MSDRTYCQQKIAGLYCDLEAADRPRFRADLASNIASPDPRGHTYERLKALDVQHAVSWGIAMRSAQSDPGLIPCLLSMVWDIEREWGTKERSKAIDGATNQPFQLISCQ